MEAHQFRENQFSERGFQYSFGSKVRTYIQHTDTYIYMINTYMCDIHTGCVVLSGKFFLPILHTLIDTYQRGALLLVRVEPPISQHTAVLLGCV